MCRAARDIAPLSAPQRLASPQYVSEAIAAVSGDTTYGRRARPTPGGMHAGVDELGFSIAWRTQPRHHGR